MAAEVSGAMSSRHADLPEGHEHEAVKRRAMRFDGVYFDALLMSLLHDAA
jgi:hypothetical protein